MPVLGASFTDPEDGQFDVSEWLLDQRGFLPVPILITEPAVGYGGGVALLFFRESLRDVAARSKGGQVTPPDIFGVATAATENGTKFLGGFGLVTFDEDRWRYRGGVARTDVNLKFYGVGSALGDGRDIGYSLEGIASSQEVLRRLGDTNHFLTLRWVYLDLETRFDPGRERPAIADPESRLRSSGLGLSWEYDGRDNIFTPSRGMLASFDTLFYRPAIGSDTSFETYRAHLFAYTPLGNAFVLGTRLDGRAARGTVPFYQLPYIDMRGIPAGRFQDENVAVAEAELRWNLTPRWALVGFAGVGRRWGRGGSYDDADNETTKGAGFRYLISRRLGLYMGVDVAWGPEDRAYYIQVGGAWR
jgi:outer membrane protein assembly factor BamA